MVEAEGGCVNRNGGGMAARAPAWNCHRWWPDAEAPDFGRGIHVPLHGVGLCRVYKTEFLGFLHRIASPMDVELGVDIEGMRLDGIG